MSEAEAMKHPRRSEVFRDVGSAFHEPDDPDFIELVAATFEPDAALLLCSDGLSDMISSAVILRTVREQAGAPDRVVSRYRRGEPGRRQGQHYGGLRRRLTSRRPARRPTRRPNGGAHSTRHAQRG